MRALKKKVPKTCHRRPKMKSSRSYSWCARTPFEGRRNRALVALLANSGLGISEGLRPGSRMKTSLPGPFICAKTAAARGSRNDGTRIRRTYCSATDSPEPSPGNMARRFYIAYQCGRDHQRRSAPATCGIMRALPS